MNKNIYFFIFCLIGSIQVQAMFQNFSSTCSFIRDGLLSVPLVVGSYVKKINDLSTLSANPSMTKRNSFLAQPINNKVETISRTTTKRDVIDLAKNRTQKENIYKKKHNPALDELLAFNAKYGHKEYWSDNNNTGQTNLYKYASNALVLKPKVQIDFSKVDFSPCSKGSKVEKFKDQSKATLAFPVIEKFTVKQLLSPEKTFDASDYTNDLRPCAQAENYL